MRARAAADQALPPPVLQGPFRLAACRLACAFRVQQHLAVSWSLACPQLNGYLKHSSSRPLHSCSPP